MFSRSGMTNQAANRLPPRVKITHHSTLFVSMALRLVVGKTVWPLREFLWFVFYVINV
jgi:hypothetical protein